MNKRALLTVLILLLTLQGVAATADLSGNTLLYWSHDNSDVAGATLKDRTTNSRNGTITGATTGQSGLINESFAYGVADWTTYGSSVGAVYAWSFWVYPTAEINSASSCQAFYGTDNTAPYNGLWAGNCAGGGFTNEVISFYSGSGGDSGYFWNQATMGVLSAGAWSHVAMSWNTSSSNYDLYINGVYKGAATKVLTPGNMSATADGVRFGGDFISDDFDNGKLDEFAIFNDTFTQANVNTLYASGSGIQYPYSTGGSTSNNTYTVNVDDLFDLGNLQGVNVSFYNATYTTSAVTDASGNAVITLNSSASPASFSYNASKSGYFNSAAGMVAANSTATVNITQAMYTNVTVTSVVTGAAVDPNFTLNVQGGRNYTLNGSATSIYLRSGAMNFTFSKTGWYNLTFQKNITVLSNTTGNATGAYSAIVNVTAKNAYTNASITTFNVTASNTTYAYSQVYTTAAGVVSVYLLKNMTLPLYIEAANYAISNTTNYYTFVSNDTEAYNYTFGLYTNNSILIRIYDETTGLSILSNVSVTVSTNTTEFTNYTTSGELFLENLTDGEYTIKLLAANYSLRSYVVTVASRSTQTLNAYLSSSTGAVILTIKDSASAATLEGASIAIYRYINGTLTLVESKTSDITGRAQFTYSTGIKYVFTVDLTGYDSKTFSLDPIIFTSYDVFLDRIVSEAHDYADVGIDYTPSVFNNNANHSFTFLFSSPNGVLTAYNLSMRWPGGSYSGAGNTSNGQTFSTTVNISNAQLMDTVNLTFRYSTVFGDNKTYTRLLGINNGNTQTLVGIEQKLTTDYGMGLFERILLAILITVLAAGLATMAAGSTAGFILGLLVMGFFTFTGFIPALAAGITFIVGLLILAKRTGD